MDLPGRYEQPGHRTVGFLPEGQVDLRAVLRRAYQLGQHGNAMAVFRRRRDQEWWRRLRSNRRAQDVQVVEKSVDDGVVRARLRCTSRDFSCSGKTIGRTYDRA